jgi:hypothetical protein
MLQPSFYSRINPANLNRAKKAKHNKKNYRDENAPLWGDAEGLFCAG